MYRKVMCSLVFLAASVAAPAFALTASQTVEREVIVRNVDGSQTITREAADKVTPGDKVIYSLNYYNDAAEPADNIVLVMPIPSEINYIDGSADTKDAFSVYSVDGGKVFADRDDLRVLQADGNDRAALAEDITHIRWTVKDAVAPEASGTLSFSGRLQQVCPLLTS